MTFRSLRQLILCSLPRRFMSDGGMSDLPNGPFRVDCTGWGILAFHAAGGQQDLIHKHRERLIREQDDAGRVCVDRNHQAAYWPTALAILAWQNSSQCATARDNAIRFLVDTAGVQSANQSNGPFGHNLLLKGWPWIDGTHAWIEPTALSIIALKTTRYSRHDRVNEAVRMILDRQLVCGGWNYGNTVVFGRNLHPAPDSTGAALTALAGIVSEDKVEKSVAYLQGEVGRLATPISLGWALLGLGAWNHWPSNGLDLVEKCLAHQSRYGDYETSALGLLSIGALAGDGNYKALS